jgi:hypothetical protein
MVWRKRERERGEKCAKGEGKERKREGRTRSELERSD